MQPLDRFLWLLTGALAGVVLARIISLGTWRKEPQRSFAVMLAINVGCDAALFPLSNTTHLFAVLWELTLPLRLGSHVYAAVSVYRATAALYPKIGRFAVWLFSACLAVAALACFATLPWELAHIDGNQAFVRSLFLLHRWLDGLSAGALICSSVFLRYFPRPLKRMPSNLVWHTAFLAAYFSIASVTAIAENLLPMGEAVWIERIEFSLVALLYLGWTFALSKAGEATEPWPELDAEVVRMADNANRNALAAHGWLSK